MQETTNQTPQKRYYWLKLKRDFFKRHDIRIIESQENGKDYVLFYLKMLLESIDHDGELRFSAAIPYDEKMLSIITNTNIDIVRAAMNMFIGLQMIEVMDDKTIFMNEVSKLVGSESWSAERVRRHRAKTALLQCNATVTKSNEEIEKEKELEKELDIVGTAVPKQPKRFKPPSVDEVRAYCRERKNKVDAEKFIDYYTANGWKVGKNPMKDWKAAARTWERNGYDTPKTAARPSKEVGAHRYDQRQYTESQLDAGTSDLVAEALRARNG